MNNRRRTRKLPVILEREELEAMILLPNTRYLTSLRNKAIMKIMANCGLRVSEVVNLRPGDVNLTKGKLRVVNGKGGVDREIPFKTYEGLIAILKKWKDRKPSSDYFFCTIRDNSKGKFKSSKGSKLAVRTVQAMIPNYAKRAGINKPVTPHTFRHTFATDYYRKTKDLEALRKVLGHADIGTTQIYVTLANIDVENGMSQREEF